MKTTDNAEGPGAQQWCGRGEAAGTGPQLFLNKKRSTDFVFGFISCCEFTSETALERCVVKTAPLGYRDTMDNSSTIVINGAMCTYLRRLRC